METWARQMQTLLFQKTPVTAWLPGNVVTNRVHNPAYIIRKLKEEAYIFPVILPIADRARILFPIFLSWFPVLKGLQSHSEHYILF